MEPIPTRVAHTGHEEHRFLGHLVFGELAGEEGWGGLWALAAGGQRLSVEDREVLDDMAVVTCLADPRVWPLKVSRLVASYGGTVAGYCAGSLALEDALVGPWSSGEAARLLLRLRESVDRAPGDEGALERAARALAAERRLPGFGVPFRPRDERVLALGRCLERRGRAERRHWLLLRALAAAVRAERGLEPNLAIGLAAAALDLGFDPPSIARLGFALVQHHFLANAAEAAGQRAALLVRIPEASIEYVGAGPRVSPRARAAGSTGPR